MHLRDPPSVLHIYTYTYIQHIHTYTCIHIYTYIHFERPPFRPPCTYTYTHTHTHIHICSSRLPLLSPPGLFSGLLGRAGRLFARLPRRLVRLKCTAKGSPRGSGSGSGQGLEFTPVSLCKGLAHSVLFFSVGPLLGLLPFLLGRARCLFSRLPRRSPPSKGG